MEILKKQFISLAEAAAHRFSFKCVCSQKLYKFHWKTPVLESVFSEAASLKGLQHRCFPVKFANLLRTPFLQNYSGCSCIEIIVYLLCSKELNGKIRVQELWQFIYSFLAN